MIIPNITTTSSTMMLHHGSVFVRQAAQEQAPSGGGLSKWVLGGIILGVFVGIGMLGWAGAVIWKCATGDSAAKESRADHAQRLARRQNSGPEEHQVTEKPPATEEQRVTESLPLDEPPPDDTSPYDSSPYAHLAHPRPTRPGGIKFVDADSLNSGAFPS